MDHVLQHAFVERQVRDKALQLRHLVSQLLQRLYHVHHKPLYHAIGEAHSRYRRTVPARAVPERLLRLDAALLNPEVEWLTTRSAKFAHMAAQTSPGASEPHAPLVQDAPDLLPGTFPIGIDSAGRAIVIYIATKPWTDDFRSFLVGHVPLLAATRTWTLRIVFPSALRRVVPDYQRAMHEELESRFDLQTINDLGWYFFHVRRRTNWSGYPSGSAVITRFARCAKGVQRPTVHPPVSMLVDRTGGGTGAHPDRRF